jgi:hypothetical protein
LSLDSLSSPQNRQSFIHHFVSLCLFVFVGKLRNAFKTRVILKLAALLTLPRCPFLISPTSLGNAFEETWQLDVTATSVDSQVPVQQWCKDDALLYWFEEFDKLRKDKSVEEAFQCIQQSETIHPLLRGFVNNDDEWEYFIDILKMIHRADGKYKLNVLLEMPMGGMTYHVEEVAARGA